MDNKVDNKAICLVCGHELPIGSVRCPNCRAVYPQNPQNYRDQFDRYEKHYNDRSRCIFYLRRGRIYETIVAKILHISKIKYKGAITFLDIGASVGMSIVLLEQYGKALGTELDIPQLRRWHRFLDIESHMLYMPKTANVNDFYVELAKELNGKIDVIFLIDTFRFIPLPTLIDIVSSFLKENGAIVIKEANPDNKKNLRKGNFILFSPDTMNYLAKRIGLNVNWYLVSSAIDNFAVRVPYNMLKMFRFRSYVAVLRKGE